MTASDGLPPLRDVIAEWGIDPKKSLGQNFLFDLNLTGKIARAGGDLQNVTAIEIGPGPGGLTRALLSQGAQRVIAIERDQRALPALAAINAHYNNKLDVLHDDALTCDWASHLKPHEPCRIIANLPYNIGTALLIQWLESPQWPPRFDSLVLMFQREVAERIVASPAQPKDYGRLAVLSNWRCQTKILFDVPASAFTPPPKVTSSVVQLVPRAEPLPCSMMWLTRITAAAFGQRRKMLRQSLKALGLNTAELIAHAGLDETARAETIPIEGFVNLANAAEILSAPSA
jgi:16S rRNA (adenine1518-N6/adenine1519-N6)-dimethyltransferase